MCNSIELPWLDNQKRISCIPEGKYELKKRYTHRFGFHLHVIEVPDREYILIHAANNAIKEMHGCIAPVSKLTGEGKGNNSRVALKKFIGIVYPEMEKGNKVFLTIKSQPHE